MTEYRSVLERAGSNAPQPDLQVERVLRRRDRRHRNQRISAGTLGVIVMLVLGIIFVRTLMSDPIPADPPPPRPAPAASGTLAYVLDGDVHVADPDGSHAVTIADGLSAEDCYSWSGEYWAEGPMWSPDGRYLAFRRYTDCGSEATPRPRDVVISDAEGNVLAAFPAQGWDIAWSPDSTRVGVWDELFSTIGVYGLDGARQTQLMMPSGWTPSGDHDPVWTSDGTSLVVESVELPIDGSTPRPTEGTELFSPLGGDSPDGSHTAYVDRRSLIVARSDGSGSVTLLTVEPGTDLGVIGFSPQGDRILFSRTEDRGTNWAPSLWSIGVDGSDARLVVAGTAQGEWLSPSQIG